jgi:hypothetical protein
MAGSEWRTRGHKPCSRHVWVSIGPRKGGRTHLSPVQCACSYAGVHTWGVNVSGAAQQMKMLRAPATQWGWTKGFAVSSQSASGHAQAHEKSNATHDEHAECTWHRLFVKGACSNLGVAGPVQPQDEPGPQAVTPGPGLQALGRGEGIGHCRSQVSQRAAGMPAPRPQRPLREKGCHSVPAPPFEHA